MERSGARKPTAARKQEIQRAALRIIGERGVTALTTATLAREVGVTTGALFRHFATLDDVLRHMVDEALPKVEATFPDPSLPPLERLLALARNRVDVLGADPGLAWLLRSEQALLTLPADAVESLRGLLERSRRYLLDAVRQGMREGSIRKDIEPEVLLVPIMGTIHALAGMPGIHKLAGRRKGADPGAVLEALRRLLALPMTS
jgi:AcrR family transcriptional regulator